MQYKFDLDEIKKQTEEVIRWSQGFSQYVPLTSVGSIIDKWLVSKKYFIEKMNGNLIYELPQAVSFELDDNSKRRRIETFAEIVENHYGNYGLSYFLSSLRPEDFYNNKTSDEYYCDGICIPSNFKVVKAFKFFVDDKALLHKLQSEASAIIQESIVTGRLCFSVHPLDFLSASENAHNWRSCHALDGEYRTGNLNYLLDSNTVICYLRAEKPAVLPHFPPDRLWNSKKWRVWMFFSDDRTMLFAGRQYPFEANQGLELIKKNIFSDLNLGTWTEFYQGKLRKFKDPTTSNVFHFPPMVPVGTTMKAMTDLIIDGDKTYHYDDLLHSSCYDPVYSYKTNTQSLWYDAETTGCSNNSTVFHIGEPCPCPICGKDFIFCGEVMACAECNNEFGFNDEDYEPCSICGTSVFWEDLITLEFSEERVCQACYQREATKCQSCGSVDLPEIIKYVPSDGRCLCPSCRDNLISIENIEITL